MARRKSALRIVYPEEQRYECRDCPARCCKTWGIPVAPEVAHEILSDEELRGRLVGRAPGVLASGTLPMIERDRQLQCVLLDDDHLCALHKRLGHEALPSACQAYPFGFLEDEGGRTLTLLSRHCPSIRDNYGHPVGPLVRDKLSQAGGALPLAARMGLRSGRTLPVRAYLAVAEVWKELLREEGPVPGILKAYEFTDAFDECLLREVARGTDPEPRQLQKLLDEARARLGTPRVRQRRRPIWQARIFYAHFLGGLSYPTRVLTEYAVARPTVGQRIGAWGNKLAWMLHVGTVDLLHVPGRVAPGKIDRVPTFLAGEQRELVVDYLCEVIDRRQPFTKMTYLTRALVNLGLSVALVSRFARASALGHGHAEVTQGDVAEAVGVADLLMTHRREGERNLVLDNLQLVLMSNPRLLPRFLASEA